MIVCRSAKEIQLLRAANVLVAEVLRELQVMVAPGVTTQDLDAAAETRVQEAGARPGIQRVSWVPSHDLCVRQRCGGSRDPVQ